MMTETTKKIWDRGLFPLLSVLLTAGYIHFAMVLHMYGYIQQTCLVWACFLPVLFLEYIASRKFRPPLSGHHVRWFLAYFLRILFWFGFFWFWVVFVTKSSNEAVWLKWFAPQFYIQFYIVFRGEQWLTLLAAIAWLLLYCLLTVWLRRARIFTGMVIPTAISMALFFHLYHYGGVGQIGAGSITDQPGIEKIFDVENVSEYRIPEHPRGIYYDQQAHALFLMYGCTFCEETKQYPSIVRLDFNTGATNFFISGNIRQVAISDGCDSMYVAPWAQQKIYALSKEDLSIQEIYTNDLHRISYWEPMSIIRDPEKEMLYIGNDVEPVVAAYNLRDRRFDHITNLADRPYVSPGGPVWNLVQSLNGSNIYFTAGPGDHLFKLDTRTFEVAVSRRFPDQVGTAIALDEEAGILYYQNGGLDSLYKVDINTFEVLRTYTGEAHARRIVLDKSRNHLYVLGYLSGTLFAINLESGKRSWSLRVGGLPHGLHLVDNTLYVNAMPGVYKVDLNQMEW